ncbi:MAG: MgtC/SapB family protein [Prevotellaceae bacterium]|jgi:putative Mg2+ transporter-C (MgtC) family protein|nr:MgtC/SapB family protein [Prevotellaceae bacterium]
MATELDITLRLAVAMLLGGVIGFEREYRAKDAGFRTHFLVALGSALFCIVSQFGFGFELKDSSRVAAQVVSGIGFLGAGTIIFQKNVVRGLTTAAGLWVTAAIGLACGTGMYLPAVVTTLMVLIGLEILSAVIPRVSTSVVILSFSATSQESVKKAVREIRRNCLDIISYELKERKTSQGVIFETNLSMKVKRDNRNEQLIEYLNEFDDVTISSIE